jgi:hypothetical protein
VFVKDKRAHNGLSIQFEAVANNSPLHPRQARAPQSFGEIATRRSTCRNSALISSDLSCFSRHSGFPVGLKEIFGAVSRGGGSRS